MTKKVWNSLLCVAVLSFAAVGVDYIGNDFFDLRGGYDCVWKGQITKR